MMKISLYIERIANRAGGAERVVTNLANQLQMHGYDVEVVCYENTEGRPFYGLNSEIGYRNLKVVISKSPTLKEKWAKRLISYASKYDCIPVLNKIAWSVKNRGKIRRLTQYFRDNPTDLIVGFLPNTFVVTSLVAGKLRTKYILSLHNVPKEDFENPSRWDQNFKDKKLRFKALKNSNANTVILEEFKNYFTEGIREHTFTVRNFICRPETDSLPLLSRPKRIIAAGRYAEPKDHKTLIKAWAQIHQDCPDWSVSIYGEGPLNGKLIKMVKEHNIESSFHIHRPTRQIDKEYANSQIFCIPSLFEGFGLVTVEAMSLGLPCVGFASCPGTNRLINDRNGRLIKCKEAEKPDALAQHLKTLILDADLREELSESALNNAEGYFVENRISDWIEMIRKITDE